MTTTGWTRVRLGDGARQVSEHEHDPISAGLNRYVGLEHLDPEHITVERWGDISDGTTFTKRFRAGQLLFAKRRAYQRKAAVADFDGLCSGDLIVIEANPDVLLPELLPYIVHTDRFLDHALRTSSGSLSPRTKWKDLAEYEFDLPPLERQRAVVEVAKSSSNVPRAAEQCSRALDMLLAAVRRQHFSEDAEGKLVPLSELAAYRNGRAFRPVDPTPNGLPIIRIAEMLDRDKEVDRFDGNFEDKHYIDNGDLLFSWSATLAVVVWDRGPALLNQHLFRVDPNPGISKAWLREALVFLLDQLNSHTHGTTMRHITKRTLEKVYVRVPDEEQCKRIGEQFRQLRAMEESLQLNMLASRTIERTLRNRLLARSMP